MITNVHFKITPDKILFPEFPSFDLRLYIEDTGWIFTDLEYTWRSMPGYLSHSKGDGEVSDHTGHGKGLWFYLYLDGGSVKEGTDCILTGVPEDYRIGSKGSASPIYSGTLGRSLHPDWKGEFALYSDWEVINSY